MIRRRRRTVTVAPVTSHLPPARIRAIPETVVVPHDRMIRPYACAAATAPCGCGVEVRRGDHILRRPDAWCCHNCTTALLHPSELGVYR